MGDATTANRISLLPVQRPSAWKALGKRCKSGITSQGSVITVEWESRDPNHVFVVISFENTQVILLKGQFNIPMWQKPSLATVQLLADKASKGTLIAFPSGNKTPRCCLPVEITRRRPAGGQQLSQTVKTYFLQARDDWTSPRSRDSVFQRLVSSETSLVLTIPRGLHLRWQELFIKFKIRRRGKIHFISASLTLCSSLRKWKKIHPLLLWLGQLFA